MAIWVHPTQEIPLQFSTVYVVGRLQEALGLSLLGHLVRLSRPRVG